MKKIEDLLDLTLREILENYVAINNLECGFYYGIADNDLIEEIYQEYNIEDEYPEAFDVENLINDELIVSYQEPLLTKPKLEKIMKNLGISKKNKGGDK